MQSLARLHNGLAHDLKSPLNTMVLNLELLKRSFQGTLGDGNELRDRQQRWVSLLERELHRLRQNLELVMAQLTIPDEKTEALDLRHLLEDLEALLTPQARQRHIELRCSAPASLPTTVNARRAALRQALLAVAAHLVDAVEDEGTLTLELTAHPRSIALRLSGSPHSAASTEPGEELPVRWAQAVAAENGGTSEWTTTDGGEILFELTLPLANPRS